MAPGYDTYTSGTLVYTVEPPNKGHYGANDFVPYREVVSISEGPLSEVPLYITHQYVYLRLTSMARGCRERWKCCRACSSQDRPHATWLHSRHACSHTHTHTDTQTHTHTQTPKRLEQVTEELLASHAPRRSLWYHTRCSSSCEGSGTTYLPPASPALRAHSPPSLTPLSWLLLNRRAANEECRRTTRPTVASFWAAARTLRSIDIIIYTPIAPAARADHASNNSCLSCARRAAGPSVGGL